MHTFAQLLVTLCTSGTVCEQTW